MPWLQNQSLLDDFAWIMVHLQLGGRLIFSLKTCYYGLLWNRRNLDVTGDQHRTR